MPKKLICSQCKTEVGEINKGKIKKDAVLLCGACNYKLLLLLQEKKNDPLSILNDILKGQ